MREKYYREKVAAKLYALMKKKQEFAELVAEIEHSYPELSKKLRSEMPEYNAIADSGDELLSE